MRFKTLTPRNSSEALEMLKTNQGELLPVAGGTNVLVDLHRAKIRPAALVDLSRLDEWKEIKLNNGVLEIGSLVTHAQLASNSLLDGPLAGLRTAAGMVGGPQIRNRGTLAGNLQSASPAADTATPLLALGAVLTLVSANGHREVAADKFFTGPGKTVLEPFELVSKVTIKTNPAAKSVFYKIGKRNAMAISLINLAACLESDSEGKCVNVGIALGAVAPTPVRAKQVEAFLLGKKIDEAVILKAQELVEGDISPISDIRAEAGHRRHLAKVLVKRALQTLARVEEE